MPLLVNKVTTRAEYEAKLDKVHDRASTKFKGNPELLDHLDRLLEFGKEVASYAHEYDFNGTQANGYWSLLEFGIKLIEYGIKNYNKNDEYFAKEYTYTVKTVANGVNYVKVLREDSKATGSLEASSSSTLFKFSDDYSKLDKEIGAFFGPLLAFSSGQMFFKIVYMVIAYRCAVNFKEGLMSLFNEPTRRRILINLTKTVDIWSVKNALNQGFFSRRFTPWAVNGQLPHVQKTIFVKRQTKWTLDCDLKEQTLEIVKNSAKRPNHGDKATIRCRVLYQHNTKRGFQPDRLIFNCHGGGFVIGAPESSEVFLRDWAKKLPGVAIVSVDYTLAPEGRFPVMIQEILDVYLWLVSGDPDVEQVVGYHPKKIMFCGDSSGANVSMSTLMVLSDIRKKWPQEAVLMPISYLGLYGSYSLAPVMQPAMLFACTSPVLYPTVLAAFAEAYVPFDTSSNVDENMNSARPPLQPKFWARVQNNVSWYLCTNKVTNSKPIQTYNSKALETRMKATKLISHPYVSPTLYDDFESLADVAAYLVCCSDDPVLDHSITFAKKWKGPVKLDMMNNLRHGFLNMLAFGGVFEEGAKVVLNRVKQSLDLY